MIFDPDNYPVDHTGYGPSGAGWAPSARQMRANQMDRFRSTRNAMAMQYMDPYITGAGTTAMQIVTGDGANSAADARRRLYSSTGGQVALDAAMAARRSGMLGYGDPVNYAHNIYQGVASGGFQTDIYGTNADGQNVYGRGQHTAGSGVIAERVSLGFQRGLMRSLYGGEDADPRRMRGYDMEEISGVFRTLASRGTIGRAAVIKRNASLRERIGAAAEGESNPLIRKALQEVSLSGTEEQQEKQFEGIIEKMTDPRVKRSAERVLKSTDAIAFNKDSQRRMADMIDKVTEGMAALSDIYGDMSAPEVMRKMENISGQRITSMASARRAQVMTEQLRGAADISGMDPYAFMQYADAFRANMQGRVFQAGGFDATSATQGKIVNAALSHQILTDASISSRINQNSVMKARGLGINMADAMTTTEAAADRANGRVQFLERYQGIVYLQGGMQNLTGEQQARAEEILEAFRNTTDPDERRQLDQSARALVAASYSRPGKRYSFAKVMTSASASRAIAAAYLNPSTAADLEQMTSAGRRAARNTGQLRGRLSEFGIDIGADTLLENIGARGLTDMLDVSVDQNVKAGDKKAMIMKQLGQAGLTGADAEGVYNQLFDATGKVKDMNAYRQVTRMLGGIDPGGTSTYDQKTIGREKLAMIGKGSQRSKLMDADGGLSIRSIATSLAMGRVASISDSESTVLALQALKDNAGEDAKWVVQARDRDGELMFDKDGKKKMVDLYKGFTSGMDFSKGLTAEGLAAIEKAYGKNLGLAGMMGFEDDVDADGNVIKGSGRKKLIEATQGDAGMTEKAIRMLQGGSYEGFSLSGAAESMTVTSDEVMNTAGSLVDDKFMATGAAMMVAKQFGMSKEETSQMEAAALAGKGVHFDFSPSMFSGKVKNPWGKNNKYIKMGEGMGRVMELANMVNEIDPSTPEGKRQLAALREDKNLLRSLEAQEEQLGLAQQEDDSIADVRYRGLSADKKKVEDKEAGFDDAMASIKNAIDALGAGGGGGIGNVAEMTVQNLKVTGTYQPNDD